MKRKIKTYENNCMSLSCSGEMTIDSDNVILSRRFKGYPRANGIDAWVGFYRDTNIGDKIDESRLQNILSFNGRDNIVSVVNEV